MKDVSVRAKILILSTIMIAMMITVSLVGISYNGESQESIEAMYGTNLMATQYLNDANVHYRTIEVDIVYILQGNDNRELLQEDILMHLASIQEDMDKLKETMSADKAQRIIQNTYEHLSNASNAVKMTKGLSETAEDKIVLYKNLMIVRLVADDLNSLTPQNVYQGKVLFEQNSERYTQSIRIFILIIVIAITLALTATYIISNDIHRALSALIMQLNKISSGDLTTHPQTDILYREVINMNLLVAVVTGGSIMQRLRLKPFTRLVYYEICRIVNAEYGWETITKVPVEITNASLAMTLGSDNQNGKNAAAIGHAMKTLKAAKMIDFIQNRRAIGRSYSIVLTDLQRYNSFYVTTNNEIKEKNDLSMSNPKVMDNDSFISTDFSVLEIQDELYEQFDELDQALIDTAIQMAVETVINSGKTPTNRSVRKLAEQALAGVKQC